MCLWSLSETILVSGHRFSTDFWSFLVPKGARAPFRTPSGIQGRKRAKKRAKQGPQMEMFLEPLPSFWPLGGSFGDPGGQKERPKGLRGRFCGHRKNIDCLLVFIGFWSFGPPGGGLKAVLERHFESTGALRGHFGPTFGHCFRA